MPTDAGSAPPSPTSRPGLRAIVAFGPTHEPIDDVRFIGNRSSGRMGAAIAGALREAGCTVTAVRGPGAPEAAGCRDKRFRTAADLLSTLRAEWPAHDLLVMAAAVADFRPAAPLEGKLRRESGPMELRLEPTQDILSGLAGTRRPDQYVVGFALERPEELVASARAKLERKRADAVVANPLETMDAADVDARVLLADGGMLAPAAGRMAKDAFARWLVGELLPRAERRRAGRG